MHSLNVVGNNIDKIAQLFPNCVTERIGKDGKPEMAIDFDKLKAELTNYVMEEGEERYQFTWPGKRAASRLANETTTQTLRPCREESVDFDNTQNLYIEGDNLEVLKVLRETYLGKVKMIYIDPPYNTGNDFVYNDDFAQGKTEFEQNSGLFDEEGNQTIDPMLRNTESNGRFHTDWLNMIYPRLKVAKDLLTDDGVIFISIDDHEVENLKKVCNEIFGDLNFVAELCWRKTFNQSNIGNIAKVKEYILLYCKSQNLLKLGRMPLSQEALKEYRYSDKKGRFSRTRLMHTTRGRYEYSIISPNGIELSGSWMVSKERLQKMIENDEVYWAKDGDGYPNGKVYLDMDKGQISNDFLGKDFGSNQQASLDLDKLMGGRFFDFSKPVSLIKHFVTIGNTDDSIILDFFSGSATTAHAVMQLNAEDGGTRKFIMVQLPELTDEKSEAYKAGYKNICEIGKERIRRAGKKIKEENADKEGIENLDTGFRVLKLDSSNMNDVYYTPEEFSLNTLFSENVKEDRTAEDLLFQVMLDLGIELSAKIEKQEIAGKEIFLVDENYLIACFDKDVNETTITEIAKMHPVYFVMRDASAASDNVIDNFDQLFEAYSKDTVRKIL